MQARFRRKFQCRHAPSKSRIFDWMQKFREYGTVQNLNSKDLRDTYSGRTVSARTQRNIVAIRDSVGRSSRKSLRRRRRRFYLNKDWGCVILREIYFLLKICWSIPCLHPSWKVHTWIEICASLNHRKKTKADGSRLIPRKHTDTLVLLSVETPWCNSWHQVPFCGMTPKALFFDFIFW